MKRTSAINTSSLFLKSALALFFLFGFGACASLLNLHQSTVYVHYKVKQGDTMASVAKQLGATVNAIARDNNLVENAPLSVGMVLKVPTKGSWTTAREAPNMEPDEDSVEAVKKSTARKYIGTLLWPVDHGVLTSKFSRRWLIYHHKGIDLRAPVGTPIHAAHEGTVIYSGNGQSGYGNLVLIQTFGLVTAYAHNKQNLVTTGQHVARGETVALLGDTGHSTGPHCHFETRIGLGVPSLKVDPLAFFTHPPTAPVLDSAPPSD